MTEPGKRYLQVFTAAVWRWEQYVSISSPTLESYRLYLTNGAICIVCRKTTDGMITPQWHNLIHQMRLPTPAAYTDDPGSILNWLSNHEIELRFGVIPVKKPDSMAKYFLNVELYNECL